MFNSALLVEIFVTNTRDKVDTATGYLITPHRLVTAAHVLDEWKPGTEIQVRLYREEDKRTASVIWNGLNPQHVETEADQRDVCVLEVDTEDDLGYPSYFIRETGNLEMLPVEGRGFPVITREEGKPQAESFKGDCSHFDPTTRDRTIHVQCTSGFPDEVQWHGASGFPVFHKNELIAIAVEFKGQRKLDTIDCVPLATLLAGDGYSGFREAIKWQRYKERRNRFNNVLAEITEILRGSPNSNRRCDLLEQLPDLSDKIRKNVDAEAFASDECATTASYLLALSPVELLDTVALIQRELPASKSSDVRERIRHLRDRVLPVAISGALDAAINACQRNDGPIAAPFAMKTTAEIVMAGVDGRAMSLVIPEAGDGQSDGSPNPIGTSMLPDPPIQGLERGETAYTQSVLRDLARLKMPLGLTAGAISNIDRRFRDNPAGFNAEMGKRLSNKLKRLLKQKGCSPKRYYFAIEAPENENHESAMDAAIGEIRRLVPELVVMKLTTDPFDFGDSDEIDLTEILSEIMQHESQN